MEEQIPQSDSNSRLEIRLLIECSKTAISPQQAEQISHILNQPLDWNWFLKIADRNAVLPLVSRNLLQMFPSLLPLQVKEDLTIIFNEHVRNNIFLTGKMIEIVKLFKSNDVSIMPFKGPLLANQAYGNLALRRYTDLDILIEPAQLVKAISLLKSLDYMPVTDEYWLNNIKLCLKKKKDIKFADEHKNVFIELHWKLSGSDFDMPVTVEHLWQQTEIENLAGIEVSTLSFSHLLIYLCLHGSKHMWERLAWICDINELIRSRNTVDWENIFKEATRLGCENILDYGLLLAHEFFDLEIPNPKREKIKTNETYKAMVDEVRSRIFVDELYQLNLTEFYLYQLKLKEKFRDRRILYISYGQKYLQMVFSPNELDKASIQLPPYLTPLYYALRPVRLVFNYLSEKKPKD